MATNPPRRGGKKFERELDWYYVSRESLWKGVVGFIVLASLTVGGVLWWKEREGNLPARADREIRAAESAVSRLRTLPDATRIKEEIAVVEQKIGEAKSKLASGRAAVALQAALDARALAQRLEERGPEAGDAQIIEAAGRVELQRAGRTSWEPAREGDKLFEGDYLKTGPNGVAEVMALDGTLFKIKAGTLFQVHKTTQKGGQPGSQNRRSEMKLVVGFFDINTGEASQTTVKTDAATTRIERSSTVGVDVDDSKRTGVSTFRGSATVETQGGEKLVVSGRERAEIASSGPATKVTLPDAPTLLAPDANAAIDMRRKEPVALKWSRVPAATRYRIQIAHSRYFIPDSIVIDLSDRQKPEAVVAPQEEGSYFWRVATLAKANATSEWSEIRRFRVLSGRAVEGTAADRTPPDLVLQRPQVIGSLVIVMGKTEPGAAVTVNGEPAEPDASGVFKKTISIQKEGLNTIVVKAVDGAGNETERRETALIQSF